MNVHSHNRHGHRRLRYSKGDRRNLGVLHSEENIARSFLDRGVSEGSVLREDVVNQKTNIDHTPFTGFYFDAINPASPHGQKIDRKAGWVDAKNAKPREGVKCHPQKKKPNCDPKGRGRIVYGSNQPVINKCVYCQ